MAEPCRYPLRCVHCADILPLPWFPRPLWGTCEECRLWQAYLWRQQPPVLLDPQGLLAAIVSAIMPTLVAVKPNLPTDPTLEEELSLLLMAMTMALLSWHAPSVAAGMMAGAPSLTAGTVAHTAVAAGATTLLTGAAAIGAAQVGAAATRGALRTGSAVLQAAQLGGGQGVTRLLGATASDSTRAVTQGFRTAVAEGRVYGARAASGGGAGGFPGGGGSALARRSLQLPASSALRQAIPPHQPTQGGMSAPIQHPTP